MTAMSSELIRLVKEKGWLSIAEVIFDNTVRLPISTSAGLIAINETKGHLYFIDISGASGPLAMSYLVNHELVEGIGTNLSAFYELRIIDLEILQNFSLQTWIRLGVMETINEAGRELPAPTINRVTPVYTNDRAMFFGGDIAGLSTIPDFKLKDLSDLHVTKKVNDEFKLSQANFKKYVKLMLALPAGDVLL